MRKYFIINILAFCAVLVVNYLSNSLPLNGNTPGQLSDMYPNLFVPAGLTFSIWGIIYTWLMVWIGFQIAALFNENLRAKLAPLAEKIGYWFAISCVLNIAWLFAWHWVQIPLSAAIMIALMGTLAVLNKRAGTGLSKSNGLEKWLAHAPFGIYQGWITIALIANITTLLVSRGWYGGGLGEANWAILLILVGILLSNAVVRSTNNIFHGLAVAWALFGIYLKRSGDTDPSFIPVSTAALAGILLVMIWVVLRWRRWLAY